MKISQKPLGHFNQIFYVSLNIYEYAVVHMTKMAAKPIYGKIPSKIFFSGTGGPISTKLDMKH